jgi:hypothetical protein
MNSNISGFISKRVSNMYFERLRGRKSKALGDMIDDPIIVELLSGKTYGGAVDEYYYNGGGIVALYNCKLLEKGSRWVDHDVLRKYEGKLVRDSMPDFWIDDIKDILVLSEKLREKFSLEDALQLYIDPHFRPLSRVECNWNTAAKHSPDCDARLHEALYALATSAYFGRRSSEANNREEEEKIHQSLRYIRRRLLTTGARIP